MNYIKRTREHVLEEDSRKALRNLLPSEWIVRDIVPDYGLDMEVTIVEDGEVTTKVLVLQIKATESLEKQQKIPSLQMETKHLAYYENYPLPVLIFFYIKSQDIFYYLFAQKYIRESLSVNKPVWRKQETVTIGFPPDSELKNIRDIKLIATDGFFYIIQSKLNIKPAGAYYWLDGIPRSDDEELKRRTLKALRYALEDKYPAAIEEFENILKVCIVSPTERMSILLNTGNAYYSLSQYENALKNYKAMLDLTGKVSEEGALEGKASALASIGLIYEAKGELNSALKCVRDALNILKKLNLVYERDIFQNAIDSIIKSRQKET